MESEDGQRFIKNLASFVRTHERALANALQLQRQNAKYGQTSHSMSTNENVTTNAASSTSSLASSLSFANLRLAPQRIKPAKLSLTPHHLFYLLSRYEELGVNVGTMSVRLENIHADSVPTNYVSFIGHAPKSRGRASDAGSLRSVSSVRSIVSSVSSVWSHFTLSSSSAKAEKQQAQAREDLRYLYSAFTKIPCLRLAPDHRSRLIVGYEEFPFDTAVPLQAFKNVSSLEVCDLDFRQFHGWDVLAEQLKSLTIKRGGVDDPIDLLVNVVLDDIDKRRRRSSKAPAPATPASLAIPWSTAYASPQAKYAELSRSTSRPNSPMVEGRRGSTGSPLDLGANRQGSLGSKANTWQRDSSNTASARPISWHQASSNGAPRAITPKLGHRYSGSSGSSTHERTPRSSILNFDLLPPNKWRFLRHLSLAENSLHYLSTTSLAPLANTLQSFDLSGNLFSEIPDALASLTHLRALNLSNCMIESLHSLSRSPLPAITTLNLRSNRLLSLAGVERLYSLERLDLRDNRLMDPTELARLTGIPDIVDLYVIKNPFVSTHTNYRVTIFNLFRKTPGHAEDVVIDTVPPTYSEKRLLVDRVREPVGVPVVKPPTEEEEEEQAPQTPLDLPPQQDLRPSPEVLQSPYGHRRSASDYTGRSTRRRQGHRRRIVELSQAELPTSPGEATPLPQVAEPAPTTPTDSTYGSSTEHTPGTYHTAPSAMAQSQRAFSPLHTAFSTPTPASRTASDTTVVGVNTSPIQTVQSLGMESDMYRQKIEALKSELGSNWLAALNEDRFDDRMRSELRQRGFSPTRTIRPNQLQNRSVSVGGRTLG